jgi:hypothetical protein
MNEEEFHKRIKEILAGKHGTNDSPAQAFHEALASEVKGRSGKEWDNEMATQVMREFEWATGSQPKRESLSEDKIKDIFSTFLSERGHKLSPIKEGTKKTPDCYIEKEEGERKYVCEIKSPLLNLDNETRTYKFKTSHKKLLNFIHTAVKQFKEHDPNHKLPWVLAFTSSHFQMNWKVFIDTLQGGVINQQGERAPDFSKTPAYTSTQALFQEVDAYIWFQVSVKGERFYQASYFLNNKSPHANEGIELVGDLSKIKLSSMDNKITLSL